MSKIFGKIKVSFGFCDCIQVSMNLPSTFFFFWLHWVFFAAHGLSLVVARRGYSSLRCTGFWLQWLLLFQSTGSRHAGFSSCSTWAQQLWHVGLVVLRHVGSSQTRDGTCVPCTGRRILNHCATREVPTIHFKHIQCSIFGFYETARYFH